MANYYAHSKENIGTDQWHLLEDHLKEVAGIASGFASTFEAKDWAKIAGEFHDLGKATQAWQAYLRKVNGIDDEFAGDYFLMFFNDTTLQSEYPGIRLYSVDTR